MELFQNLEIVRQLAHDIIKPRNFVYSQCHYQDTYGSGKFISLNIVDVNSGRRLNTQLFENRGNCCIIYLHGLSSYSGQARYLVQHLKKTEISLCIFDFQGHGKSKGEWVSYGLKEKSNLYSVVREIVKKGYTEIVLWGRSMGAVTSLLFMREPSYAKLYRNFVKALILDSPFCSFVQVTQEIASRRKNIPGFLSEMVVKLISGQIYKKYGLDLTRVDVTDCRSIDIPAIFVYSRDDDLVAWQHSSKIIQNYGGSKQIVQTKSKHNEQRQGQCIQMILKRLSRFVCRPKYPMRKGISIYSSRQIAIPDTQSTRTISQPNEEVLSMPIIPYENLSNLAYL